MIKFILLFFIFLSIPKLLLAETPPVILEDGKEFYEIGLNLDILEDPTGKLTINDVNSPEWSGKFKRSTKENPNFGYSKSFFWGRVKIHNNSRIIKTWYMSQNYVLQDYITLYKKVDKELSMVSLMSRLIYEMTND